ncbi:MAG: M20/M25/M40 family metallo-hydrolase [Chloroflexota bacterium]|nr:M20/M25/M40 family metallo-hydrolase [Chloroflexota bacterium]
MTVENLITRIDKNPVYSADAIYGYLRRLLAAPAPNSGAALPGAVGGVIGDVAGELGLSLSADPRIRAAGALAIEIGSAAAAADVLITAHMDRPSFRVLNLEKATLYPLCAIRIPHPRYRCRAIAVRYLAGRIETAAEGSLQFGEVDGQREIRFDVESGALSWGDTVLMAAEPRLVEGRIIGAGLDNATGVLIGLLSARALSAFSDDFISQGRKVVVAFTDQEEGPPDGLFGQGASRLAHALPPRLGFINIDAHNVDEETGHAPGIGASQAFVSGFGRGSVVPLDYQALATDLAEEVNRARPGTVKLNYGYVSRSDDMLLSLNARCLGLIGVVLENAHTTEETAALGDLAAAVRWVSACVAQVAKEQPTT